MKAVAAPGQQGLMELMAATHAGMTTEDLIVSDWLAKARDSRFKRPYTELVYQRCWCSPICAPTELGDQTLNDLNFAFSGNNLVITYDFQAGSITLENVSISHFGAILSDIEVV